MSPEDIEQVIAAIKERYVLTEKNFNLPTNNSSLKDKINEKLFEFMENVVTQCCRYYKIDRSEINTRKLRLQTKIRMITYKICRELPENSIPYDPLGRFFNKDHASALHGYKQANNLYETDTDFRLEYTDIKHLVEQSMKL